MTRRVSAREVSQGYIQWLRGNSFLFQALRSLHHGPKPYLHLLRWPGVHLLKTSHCMDLERRMCRPGLFWHPGSLAGGGGGDWWIRCALGPTSSAASGKSLKLSEGIRGVFFQSGLFLLSMKIEAKRQ